MRKIGIGLCLIVLTALSASATLLTDTFDSGATAELLGGSWDNTNTWTKSYGSARNNAGALALVWNTGLETQSGDGFSFDLSVDVRTTTGGRWFGMAFNVQNSTNYYVLRINSGSSSYQVLRVVNGSTGVLVTKADAAATFAANTNYTLNVTSDTAYAYTFEITETGSSTVLNPTTTVGDGASSFTNGYASLYMAGGSGSFVYDNFSLEVGEIVMVPGIDDFNRADVAVTNDTSLLGGDWAQDSTGDEWTLVDGSMHSHALTAPGILYNYGLESGSGNGTNFTLSVDVSSKSPSLWSGVVFNYQDENNFYMLRFKEGSAEYQLLAVVGGENNILVNKADAATLFSEDIFYTVNVESGAAYDFDFTITEVGSSVALNSTTNAVDAGGNFTGGYAGLYAAAGFSSKFDNFVLQLVVDGYGGWADGWGVDIGADADDYDEDGLSNVYEYGLGGDPTDALDQGTSPEFGVVDVGGTNVFGYVHPQLSAENSGVSYSLELNTDLVSGIWSNTGYTVLGTNVTGGSLDFVTNVTDTAAGKKFIRLIIE